MIFVRKKFGLFGLLLVFWLLFPIKTIFLTLCVLHGLKAIYMKINFLSRTIHFNNISQAQIREDTVGQFR